MSAQEVRRKGQELDDEADSIQRQLADLPLASAAVQLPKTYDELALAWTERGIEYQRLLISMTIDRITVHPAARPSRRFDPNRLDWKARV